MIAVQNATGSVSFSIVRSIGNNVVTAMWEVFELINELPADAVIQGMYPVIIAASPTRNYGAGYLQWGSGLDLLTINSTDPNVHQNNFIPPGNVWNTFPSTTFYSEDSSGNPLSIGTSLAALGGLQIRALLNATLDQGGSLFPPDPVGGITITGVGIAIDYTSANPQTDPTMAAPFTWPSGHGLAWAVPAAISQSGHLPGALGIFNYSDATGTAVPAMYIPPSALGNAGIYVPLLQWLKIPPDANAYQILAGQDSITTQSAGGPPRIRKDQLGTLSTVNVQWTVGPNGCDYLYAFRRSVSMYDSKPFWIKLVGIDDSAQQTYTAWFVPGTFKLASQSGLTYVFQATLWVIPNYIAASGLTDNEIVSEFIV